MTETPAAKTPAASFGFGNEFCICDNGTPTTGDEAGLD